MAIGETEQIERLAIDTNFGGKMSTVYDNQQLAEYESILCTAMILASKLGFYSHCSNLATIASAVKDIRDEQALKQINPDTFGWKCLLRNCPQHWRKKTLEER